MQRLRVKGRNSLYPFQKGIIITNTSIKLLFADLKKRYDIKYLLTYRLNQDVLENFFGALRAKGGLNDHPDSLEVKYRLRSYRFGKNEGSLSAEGNVQVDDTPDLSALPILSGQLISSLYEEDLNATQPTKDLPDDDLPELVYDGLEGLAGYICHKLKEPSATLASTDTGSSSFSWVNHLSEGGLMKPSESFMKNIKVLEGIFQDFNKDSVQITTQYIGNLMKVSSTVALSTKVKSLFFKSRLAFRIRQLNRQIVEERTKKRKMVKTTT